MTALALALGQPFNKARAVSAAPPPIPTLTTLNPNTAVINVATPITVTGTNFIPSSVVYVDATPLATTYVSATSLTTNYTATVAEIKQFTVQNGAAVSNQVPFTATSGAFSPSDIAGLLAWYDSSDVASFIFSSSTVVSAWNNRASGTRHMTNPTVAQQPNRNGVQNTLATVVWGGSVLFLFDGAGGGNWPMMHDGTNYAVFFVVRYTSSAHASFLPIMGTSALPGGGVTGWNHYSIPADLKMGHRVGNFTSSGGTSCSNTLTQPWVLNNWFMYSVLADPDNSVAADRSDARINGGVSSKNSIQTTAVSAGPSQYGLCLGAKAAPDANNGWFIGSMAEILIYVPTLTDPQRIQVENYLKAKWGTP